MSRPTAPAEVFDRPDRIGAGILVLIFLGGLWLMAAPFIVGYQQRSGHWSDGTISSFAVGAGMSVLALATLVVFVAGIGYELSRMRRTHHTADDDQPDSPSRSAAIDSSM